MIKERIIFHIDVNNAFLSWSAVLLLKKGYHTDIRKIPSIIGGDESKRRGIVLAKSPVAKKYGIKTAETIYSARKKCPRLQIFSPEYEWYYEKSRELVKYLEKYTPNIEQFSVDECFLDMTGTSLLYKDFVELTNFIKEDIKNRFGYTVNVGVANNKLCAKMASDFEKPDKVHTLWKNEIEDKLWPLPVGELFMVGKSTTAYLQKIGINTIGELANTSDSILIKHFKNQAQHLKASACGIDDSKVEPRNSKRESISITETLPYDYIDAEKIESVLFRQTEEVSRTLRRQKDYCQTVAVIYKNNNFESYSHQIKLHNPTNKTKDIYDCVIKLFHDSWKKDPLRLVGVRLANFTTTKKVQTTLFDEEEIEEENDDFEELLDSLNTKFGSASVFPASIKLHNDKNKKGIQ